MSTGEWERVLWKRQPFPDNYIPPEGFLSSLRRNPNFQPYTYWPLVWSACAITQHLATIFIFLSVFMRLKERVIDPRALIWVSVGCFVVGYIAWEVLDPPMGQEDRRSQRAKALKSSILMFLALMSLSPVLKTLTAATSSDSIWALSATLFTLNALLADYSPAGSSGDVRGRLTSVLSMNAAISSSVVLASRLSDDIAVFALILFSVQMFALFPILRYRLQVGPIVVQVALTLSLSVISIFLAASQSTMVTYIYAITLLSVNFLAPAVLIWAQKYKNEIRGAWDEAVPKVNLAS